MRVCCLGSSALAASSTIQQQRPSVRIHSSLVPQWKCSRGNLRFVDNNFVRSSTAFLRNFGFTLSRYEILDPRAVLLDERIECCARNVKELPCASCRGRGYLCCKECDFNSPRSSCVECAGKGIMRCQQCQGDRVVRGTSVPIHEEFWERVHSVSSITVNEDDEAIENMSIPAAAISKRVYGPVTAATRDKISHALKDLERRTGVISTRMKMLHRDPVLHAERVAAIQKAKGTDEARKNISTKLIAYFTNPENRFKQSLRMKGVKYHCRACGEEGHRKSFCPKSTEPRSGRAESRCRFCGKVGHRINTCPQSKRRHIGRAPYKCTNCGGTDHNARTCPQIQVKDSANRCSICKAYGHNKRTCPRISSPEETSHSEDNETYWGQNL